MTSVRAWHLASAVASLLAGCASAPKDTVRENPPEPATPVAVAGDASAPRPESAASATAANTRQETGAPAISPDIVDLNRRPLNEAENTGQICRQMLKPNTNSIITVCGTRAQWKRFQEEEARIAMDNVLRMQRGEH